MTKRTFFKLLAFAASTIAVTAGLLIMFFYSCFEKAIDSGVIKASAEQINTIFSITGKFWYLVLAAVLLIVICAVLLSIAITKSIIKPVEELSHHLDNAEDYKTYNELQPFVNALKDHEQYRRALDKQKKQFTENVSHELKTPLTSIAGYAELIETGIAKQEDIKPFASVIRKQAIRLVSLSEDIIQLSQLEEESDSTIAFSSVDLYDIAKNCVETLEINARLKGVTVTLSGESVYIRANSALIEELICNLCDNAIRYNKENGSVNVDIKDTCDGVCLTVSDTGIGIDDKYKERIFERFFRVDKSRSKETGGTGLGLAIVKHIAQIHSAQLEVTGALGEGTTISVLFPK